MNIDIKKHIIKNFKGSDLSDIKASIVSSINEKDDIVLPGLGVFFKILWENSDENSQDYILNTIKKAL
ncbi:MAG: small acid-soluble spore protein SspI [Bacilli bacterium]